MKKIYRIIVHAIGLLPIFNLLLDSYTVGLTVNPIQAIIQRLGKSAILLLFLSLAISPLVTITGWSEILRHRRTIGLYAFVYAIGHFFYFSFIDFGLNIPQIIKEIVSKPYIILGTVSIVILIALAITSYRPAIKLTGKIWKPLHRLVYLAAFLVILHYGLAVKGNFFKISGDVITPLLYSVSFILLMVVRIPRIRRGTIQLRRQWLTTKTSPIAKPKIMIRNDDVKTS